MTSAVAHHPSSYTAPLRLREPLGSRVERSAASAGKRRRGENGVWGGLQSFSLEFMEFIELSDMLSTGCTHRMGQTGSSWRGVIRWSNMGSGNNTMPARTFSVTDFQDSWTFYSDRSDCRTAGRS